MLNYISSRVRYKLEEYNLTPKILMSCNPAKNWVYSDFYIPSKNGNIKEYRAFIQALVTDNRHISEHYIQNLRNLGKEARERLLKGNWEYDDDPSALVTFDAINDIFTNTYLENGNLYITCDVARMGRDRSVIMVWSGKRCEKVISYAQNTVTELADSITELRHKYKIPLSQIIVDEDGVGGGVKDLLGCKGFINNSTPLQSKFNPQNYSNLKSQCAFYLANEINDRNYFVNCDNVTRDLIKEEIEQLKEADYDNDEKKLRIVSKEIIKNNIVRSPDYLDSMIMREYFDLEYAFKKKSVRFKKVTNG